MIVVKWIIVAGVVLCTAGLAYQAVVDVANLMTEADRVYAQAIADLYARR